MENKKKKLTVMLILFCVSVMILALVSKLFPDLLLYCIGIAAIIYLLMVVWVMKNWYR